MNPAPGSIVTIKPINMGINAYGHGRTADLTAGPPLIQHLRMRQPTRESLSFRLPLVFVKTLRRVREERGIPITAQVELALRSWWRREGHRIEGERPLRRKRAKR